MGSCNILLGAPRTEINNYNTVNNLPERFEGSRVTLASTVGALPVQYMTSGVLGTTVGAMYMVLWTILWGHGNNSTSIRIFIDENDVGAGGGLYLNQQPPAGVGAIFTNRTPNATSGRDQYTGFAFITGNGSDKIDIDFAAVGASAVSIYSANLQVIKLVE